MLNIHISIYQKDLTMFIIIVIIINISIRDISLTLDDNIIINILVNLINSYVIIDSSFFFD